MTTEDSLSECRCIERGIGRTVIPSVNYLKYFRLDTFRKSDTMSLPLLAHGLAVTNHLIRIFGSLLRVESGYLSFPQTIRLISESMPLSTKT